MSTRFASLGLALPLLGALLVNPAAAAPQQDDPDRVLSPYFVVKSDDPKADRLPLKETGAEVNIAGTIAHVRVRQVYKNEGTRPLEAIYVFPGSTRSAVFGMRMTIGERVIVAKIEEKKKAREIYEQAKAAGKSASLLEQKRPNVFQMNVANILPGDTIKVELDYTELLVPEDGVYELVFPAVVGPRYNETTASQAKGQGWIESPYQRKGDAHSYSWDMKVHLDAGLDIQGVESPSHKIKAAYQSKREATIALATPGKGGDRDFVLRYRLAGKKIQTGLMLYPGEDENFFLLMVQPPKRVTKADLPPREYVFILDVSGSMRGFPLDTAKKVMKQLLDGMRAQDRFNILFFSGSSYLLSQESLRATPANMKRAFDAIDGHRGGGGTRLLQALQRAFALPTDGETTARTFVVVTDGYISVETDCFELIKQSLGEANFFSFGIGSSVNRYLIEGMARAGMGEPYVVLGTSEAETEEVVGRFRRTIEKPALTNIEVTFPGFNAYDVEPVAIPDLFAERPVVMFGKYRGRAGGRVEVKGRTGRGTFTKDLTVSDFDPDAGNQALRYLWARHRVASLADLNKLKESDERVKEVTRLGLKYNLMTKYTSFVAVDERVRNQGGEQTTVKQALPLPAGVEESAVGASQMSASGGKKAMLRSTLSGGLGAAPPPSRGASRGRLSKPALPSPKPGLR